MQGVVVLYLIRRVYKVKPGKVREAADLIDKIGKTYESAGQRSTVRVYWSGYTVPGPANTVYMDWTEETLQSPFDSTANEPSGTSALYSQLQKFQEDSSIEFYEMV